MTCNKHPRLMIASKAILGNNLTPCFKNATTQPWAKARTSGFKLPIVQYEIDMLTYALRAYGSPAVLSACGRYARLVRLIASDYAEQIAVAHRHLNSCQGIHNPLLSMKKILVQTRFFFTGGQSTLARSRQRAIIYNIRSP